MTRLDGKTLLVTGAGSGIGAAVADRFVREGGRVVFTDRDATAAVDAARRAGDASRAIGIELDVTHESSVESGFAAVADRGWELDVVVGNAGIQLFGLDAPVADLDLDVWRRTIEVNLTGMFLTLKHAVRAMVAHGRGGSIIVTGSPTALNGEGRDFTAYSASKAGDHGLARTVAAAYAEQGIRVNTVVPGYTETPLVRAIATDAEARAGIVGRTPLRRAGTPADVEGIMVYLASDESSFATGGTFRVEGGMTSL